MYRLSRSPAGLPLSCHPGKNGAGTVSVVPAKYGMRTVSVVPANTAQVLSLCRL